jgi:hypothetical protein
MDIYNASAALPFLIWRTAVATVGRLLPIKLLFAASFNTSNKLLDGYTAPFPNYRYKAGAAKW